MARRILIVDDETHIRLLLHRTLEELEFEGVEIEFADNGISGLEQIRAWRPDLVLLDLMMPGLTGVEVCREVRRDPEVAATHIIILTAKGQRPDFAEGEGPNEYLTKPFDPDLILSRVAEVVGVSVDFEL